MTLSVEYRLRTLGFILKMFAILLIPLYWYRSKRKSPKIPPITDKILLLSASQLATKIRTGQLKSENIVRVYIKRIKEVNPQINAVVDERYLQAIEDAITADNYIQSSKTSVQKLEQEQPLFGVPITIKESCCVKDMSFTGCSLSRKNIIAHSDSAAVALIRQAGAIPLVVTNTPELCFNWESNNFLFGRTVSPYNFNYTSGGSSGGEGALIGSGASVIGVGSDVAGSIRVPAMFNGIFGHKPTARIVLADGHFPNSPDELLKDVLAIGPLTRYAEDLKLMLHVLCSEHARSKLKLNQEVNIENMNVYFQEVMTNSLAAVDVVPEIRIAMQQAVKFLASKGAKCSEFPLDLQYTIELSCGTFGSVKDLPNLLQNPDNPKESLNIYIEIIKGIFGFSKITLEALLFYLLLQKNFFIPKSKSSMYLEELKIMRQQFNQILKDNGVFLFPTFPLAGMLHGEIYTKMAGVAYTMIFNVLGLPATHIPLGLNKNGMPFGIQVVAAAYQDRLCFAVAEELERKFGGWISPTEIKC